MSVIQNTLGLSTDAVKDALLLNGATDKAGSLMMCLAAARGPGTVDRHEHVIVAPSHLLYYTIGSHLLGSVRGSLGLAERRVHA